MSTAPQLPPTAAASAEADLRDFLAASALPGLVQLAGKVHLFPAEAAAVAESAYLVADAMLRERGRMTPASIPLPRPSRGRRPDDAA